MDFFSQFTNEMFIFQKRPKLKHGTFQLALFVIFFSGLFVALEKTTELLIWKNESNLEDSAQLIYHCVFYHFQFLSLRLENKKTRYFNTRK